MTQSTVLSTAFETLHPNAKIWVYLSSRRLSEYNANELRAKIAEFTNQWAAHGKNLKATGDVLLNRIVVLAVDETNQEATGCSIDSSVHFIKQMEKEYATDFFNRLLVGCYIDNEVEALNRNEIEQRVTAGTISGNTPTINTLITELHQLESELIIPLKKTWVAKLLDLAM